MTPKSAKRFSDNVMLKRNRYDAEKCEAVFG
jgi:hypothetical protein